MASRVSSAQIVEILLRKDPTGYEIRYDTDVDEKNPLHIAAERDDPDLLKVSKGIILHISRTYILAEWMIGSENKLSLLLFLFLDNVVM